MKKKRTSSKELLPWNANLSFPVLKPLGFFAQEKVNRKLSSIYLFNLNMSNIKSEALAQEFSKKKVFIKKFYITL